MDTVSKNIKDRIEEFILCLNKLRKLDRRKIEDDVNQLCSDLGISEPDWNTRKRGRKKILRRYSITNLSTRQIFIMEEAETAALFGIAPISIYQQTLRGHSIERRVDGTGQFAIIKRL